MCSIQTVGTWCAAFSFNLLPLHLWSYGCIGNCYTVDVISGFHLRSVAALGSWWKHETWGANGCPSCLCISIDFQATKTRSDLRVNTTKVTSNPELWNLKSAIPESSSSMMNHKGEQKRSWAPCTDPCCRCCGTTWDASPRRRHKFSTCGTATRWSVPLRTLHLWKSAGLCLLGQSPPPPATAPRTHLLKHHP